MIKRLIKDFPDYKWNPFYLCENFYDEPEIREYLDNFMNSAKIIDNFIGPEISELSQQFIEKHIDKHWDYDELSDTASEELVDKYIDKPWNYEVLSRRNFSVNFIEKHINKPWDYDWLSDNENITMDLIEKYIYKPWEWKNFDSNKNITDDFIEKYIDKPWNYYWLNSNSIITQEFVEKHLGDTLSNYGKNLNLSLEFIEKHKPSFKYLGKRTDLTTEFIKKYIDELWNWCDLYDNAKNNPKIDIKLVENYIDANYIKIYIQGKEYYAMGDNEKFIENWLITRYGPEKAFEKLYNVYGPEWEKWLHKWDDVLLKNPNISLEFIEKYMDNPIDLYWYAKEHKNLINTEYWIYKISYNPNLTSDFIEKYINRGWKHIWKSGWDWHWDWIISHNKNISQEFIEKYTDKISQCSNFYDLSGNPNINSDFIEKHLDKNWDINELFKSHKNGLSYKVVSHFIELVKGSWYNKKWVYDYLLHDYKLYKNQIKALRLLNVPDDVTNIIIEFL